MDATYSGDESTTDLPAIGTEWEDTSGVTYKVEGDDGFEIKLVNIYNERDVRHIDARRWPRGFVRE